MRRTSTSRRYRLPDRCARRSSRGTSRGFPRRTPWRTCPPVRCLRAGLPRRSAPGRPCPMRRCPRCSTGNRVRSPRCRTRLPARQGRRRKRRRSVVSTMRRPAARSGRARVWRGRRRLSPPARPCSRAVFRITSRCACVRAARGASGPCRAGCREGAGARFLQSVVSARGGPSRRGWVASRMRGLKMSMPSLLNGTMFQRER